MTMETPSAGRWSSPLLDGTSGEGPAPPRRGHRLHLEDLLQAPFQHPWWFLCSFALTFAAATSAAFLLPKRYTASCLVLVKASGVPEKIIANVADELDARRHQTIRQEILSRTRLEKVDAELHPYPAAASVSAAVAAIQANTEVSFKGRDAFSIEFTHQDPLMTQRVTNRMASLFIEEFRRSRQAQVEGAAAFLDAELQQARALLDEKDEALRRYKEANLGRLPEQLQALLSTLQRLQLELQTLEQSLAAAESRLERLTSGVSSDAPVTTAGGLSERETLEADLARLRLRYTDEHPEVRALVARLEALKRDSQARRPASDVGSSSAAQIARAREDIDTLLARRKQLQNQIAVLQHSVEQMPRTEQELALLTRDSNQLRDNYQMLLRKRMEAQTAERLQQRWTEDFEILDPARLPERHVFPDRSLFIIAGVVLGFGLGWGAAFLAEQFSARIISVQDLEATVTVPVLAVLPLVEPQEAELAVRRFAGGRGSPKAAGRTRT